MIDSPALCVNMKSFFGGRKLCDDLVDDCIDRGRHA